MSKDHQPDHQPDNQPDPTTDQPEPASEIREASSEETPEAPTIIGVKEAAKILRVNRNTLYGAVKRGEVPHFKVGRKIQFVRETLLAFISGQPASVGEA